ncbi:MAG TPA: histidine phosphatase family protein [Rhizobiaceae bacterium]|nr:histidine phosphatase family protein [Rhizobiaceae bacterium]
MKSLLLMRHAKSSWDDGSLADIDRPLAARGREAANIVTGELVRRGWIPDHVLVSPSRRTRETWAILEARLSTRPEVQFLRELYEASASRLLETLRRLPEEARTVLVIGHNPSIEELAKGLSGARSSRAALAVLQRKFPTAAVARFTVRGKWVDLRRDHAMLTDFVRPKDRH